MANRKLNVDITGNSKGLKSELNSAKKETKLFGMSVDGLGKKLGVLAGAAAIGAVVKGLFNMAKEVSENADRLLDLSEITGLSTDRLQEYEHVARVAGVNSETMANAVQGLTRRLARGAEMSAGLKMGLEALNIEVFDGAGNMRDLGMVSEEAIVQLAEMEDATKRNVIGAQLFSGAWKDLAPILALGADGIEAAKKEAQDLGLVMSRENLEAANDFRVEMETLNAQWTMMKREVGMGVIPVITSLVGAFRDAWERAQDLARGIDGVIRKLTDLGETHSEGRAERLQSGREEAKQIQDRIRSLETEEERENALNEEIKKRNDKIKEISDRRIKDGKIVRSLTSEEKEQIDEINSARTELLKNYDSTIKGIDRVAAAAEAAAEAERAAQEEQERQRIEALGQIGRLQEQIAEADAAFIAANSDAERVRWDKRRTDLQAELELLKERASLMAGGQEADRRGLTGMTAMPSMGAPSLISDEAHEETLKKIGEQNIAMEKLGEQAHKTGEEYEGIGQEFMYANDMMVAGIDMLMGKHEEATAQILKELMTQIAVGLIRNAVVGVLSGGASVAAGGGGGFKAIGSALTGGLNLQPTNIGFGMAEGGIVPSGFPNDTYPAMLTSGETVIPSPHPLSEAMGMSGGQVEFIIKGNNLYGVLNKEQNKRNQIGS